MKKHAEKAMTQTQRAAAELRELSGLTKEAIEGLLSPNTRRAYLSTWRDFVAWCAALQLAPLPASSETIVAYVANLAREGLRASSIDRALAAIATVHKVAGHESPRRATIVQLARKAWRRKLGTAKRGKAPILALQLRAMSDAAGTDLRGKRDRAIVLLAWHGAFRRSEVSALNACDLRFEPEGLTVTLRRSKSDQESEGARVGIPYGGHLATCAVRAVQSWIEAASAYGLAPEAPSPPLFVTLPGRGRVRKLGGERLDGKDIGRIVQRLALRAGLDIPRGDVGAHSLRAGLVTQAARAGKPIQSILKQTRHRTLAVLLDYIRDADLYRDNAAAGLGT